MSKTEKFISDCTRNCSNELGAIENIEGTRVISYHEWLTPDQERRAVEIAREEIKEEYLKRRCYGGRDNMLVILNEPEFNTIAKHFFELGIQVSNKAQKVE